MRRWLCQGWVWVLGNMLLGWMVLLLAFIQPAMANLGGFRGAQFRISEAQIQRIARLTAVRILTSNASATDARVDASGSGVIVQRQGQLYTVLTNWHVVGFSYRFRMITADGRQHIPLPRRRQLGSADLAIVQFRSTVAYDVAPISQRSLTVGQAVFSAGFPMYQGNPATTTFNQNNRVFRMTRGQLSMLPDKSLMGGYRLGYTNDVVAGMSGGSIFNAIGQLVGVNGRLKNANSAFGAYIFEDGSQPSTDLLAQMVRASWGIPISTYLRFVS